jgi:hypothetical protein
MKTKFVTVQPKTNQAKNQFVSMMDSLHSCRVQKEDNDGRMFLESISGRYFFWMEKSNDPHWALIK